MADNITQLPTRSRPKSSPIAFETGLSAVEGMAAPGWHQETLHALEHINCAMQCLQSAGILAPTPDLTGRISAALGLASTLSIMVGQIGGAE